MCYRTSSFALSGDSDSTRSNGILKHHGDLCRTNCINGNNCRHRQRILEQPMVCGHITEGRQQQVKFKKVQFHSSVVIHVVKDTFSDKKTTAIEEEEEDDDEDHDDDDLGYHYGISNRWYNQDDYNRFEQERKNVRDLVSEIGTMTVNKMGTTCTRGLEYYIHEDLESVRSERRKMSIEAVLNEQRRQIECSFRSSGTSTTRTDEDNDVLHVNDDNDGTAAGPPPFPEGIAYEYYNISYESQVEAQKRGFAYWNEYLIHTEEMANHPSSYTGQQLVMFLAQEEAAAAFATPPVPQSVLEMSNRFLSKMTQESSCHQEPTHAKPRPQQSRRQEHEQQQGGEIKQQKSSRRKQNNLKKQRHRLSWIRNLFGIGKKS